MKTCTYCGHVDPDDPACCDERILYDVHGIDVRRERLAP